MSLGQGVAINAQVCDERAFFEHETLRSGHELTAAYRQAMTKRLARTALVLLCTALSLRVPGKGKRKVVSVFCRSFPQSWM
jgi:hypothetical protein